MARPPSPAAILFDLDGVLVRSEEVWFKLLQDAGARFRGKPVTREEFAPTFGQGTEADLRVFDLKCTPEQLNRFYAENFRRHASGVWINPEAKPTLAALANRGKKLAVVTNTATQLATRILSESNLSSHFEQVVCADQVDQPKPAPDLVTRAVSLLQVPSEQTWMVGDSRYDREACAAAGVFFVGLAIDGDLRISQLSDLLEHCP